MFGWIGPRSTVALLAALILMLAQPHSSGAQPDQDVLMDSPVVDMGKPISLDWREHRLIAAR
jgi:hypothetical protein